MKRITIMALGSRGDVQPLVALGRGLADAGYRVRVVSFIDFADLVTRQGLDFHPVNAEAELLVRMAAGSGLEGNNPFRLIGAIRRSFGSISAAYEEAFLAPELRDSDAIINQLPGALYGRDLAEKLQIPHIAAAVIPLTPTRAFPQPLLARRSMGALINRASYTLAEVLVWTLSRGSVSQYRRKLGLSPAPLFYPPIRDPILNGFSGLVVPRPPDWGANVHVTGWWQLPESDWTPPADLLAFLAQGAPPVFIGFGSMIVPDPAAVTRALIDGLTAAGARGVISSGWAKLGGALPETIFKVDYVPYAWLFPRMAAVIHHGGSGTTGFALSSGVPSMIVPFVADQPYWGERTRALGVGHAPIPIKALTADKLADAIRTLMADRTMKQRAAELGAALRAEHGLAAAVEIVRGIVGQ